MRDRTRKIAKVATLAASEERRLGETAGRSQQHLDAQLDRLGELNAFRHNYAKNNSTSTSMSSAHLKDYHDFLQRLDTAVKAQQQIVRECEQNLEAHRKRWIAKRQRLESLRRVLDRYREEDDLHDARMEQKRLDDLPKSQATVFGADDD